MPRAISSLRPWSILASYIVISAAIALIPIYYLWEDCRIAEEYFGVNNDYTCNPAFDVWAVFNPFMIILYIPIIVGAGLVALRKLRSKMSSMRVSTIVYILTIMTIGSSTGTIFGVLLVYNEDQFYRSVQCEFAKEEPMPCLKGTASANLSSVLAPVEIALCVANIALVVIYDSSTRYRFAPTTS